MDDKDKIKYFCEVVTSNGLINEVENYVATDCTTRVGEKSYDVGIEGMKEHIMAVRQTYPDLKMTVIRQYRDGDYIISEFIAEGTHKGECYGIAKHVQKRKREGNQLHHIPRTGYTNSLWNETVMVGLERRKPKRSHGATWLY